jgi:hypothetical protein
MNITDSQIMHAMASNGGGFASALAQAAFRADPENLARIKAAFPELWATYAEAAACVAQIEAQMPEFCLQEQAAAHLDSRIGLLQ